MNLYDEWFLNRLYIKTFLSIGKYCEKNLDLDLFLLGGVGANGLSFKPTRHNKNFSEKVNGQEKQRTIETSQKLLLGFKGSSSNFTSSINPLNTSVVLM